MALTTVLQFGDNSLGRYSKEYLVVSCRSTFSRSYNHLRPEGKPRLERVELTVEVPGKEDLGLYDWYMSQDSQDGRIVFNLSPTTAQDVGQQKALMFENAQCLSLTENYEIGSQYRRQLTLAFEADTITVDDVEFKHL
jgi:hypothetical protein